MVTGNGLGNECYAALTICDQQGTMSRGLVLPGPQLVLAVPGPARPQRAIYQHDRSSGGLRCIFFRRPVFLCCLLDEWRQERDVPRYCRLVDVEDVRPHILDDILPYISAGNDQRLPQSQLTRSPFSLIPWFFEQSGHAIFQLVKLLSIQS